MKKVFLLIIKLIIFVSLLQSSSIYNSNTPAKGDWNLKAAKLWSVDEAGDLPVLNISDIVQAPDGRVYVLSYKYSRVSIFSAKGEFISSFGKKGEGPGEFRFCFNMEIVDNNLILMDNSRLHYFDLDGKFIKTVTLQGRKFPKAFIDANSFLYSVKKKEDNSETLFLYNIEKESSKELNKFSDPGEMKASTGKMTIMMSIPGLSPELTCTAKDGKIFYGISNKYSISSMNLKGKKLMDFSIKDRDQVKVTQNYKESFFKGKKFSLNGGKPSAALMKQLTASLPDYAAFFGGFYVTNSGHILVNTRDIYKKNRIKYDIFSPAGKYLYKTSFDLPEGLSLREYTLTDNNLCIFVEDEDGENSLIKYKIELP